MTDIQRKCLYCGKQLVNNQKKFCCDSCRGMFHNTKEVEKICPICGKQFIGKKYVKYCSQDCINKSVQDKVGKDGFCLHCGKPIRGINGKKFCDRKCKDRYKYHKELKTCECCGKEFMGSNVTKYCSPECRAKCRKESFEQTNLSKYGVLYPTQNGEVKEKGKQTCIERYGVENAAKLESTIEKMKSTALKRYGTENPMQNELIKQKAQNTNIERYGAKSPMQNDDIKNKAKANLVKTIKGKYGVDNVGQIDEVKEKIVQTNMQKYGVPYYCMTEDCGNAGNTISKVNILFDEMLHRNRFETQKEFAIGKKAYDIKVGDVLIDINPFPYHNTTWSPKREPVDEMYHYNKLKLAIDSGYQCIMVWDWDDWDKIVYLLDDNKKHIHARKCEVEQVDYEEACELFKKYHLQGDTKKNKNNIYVGLYYNNELVECMSFGKPRYNDNYEWEILRLCSHKDYRVVGGANKIFKYFLSLTNAKSVISYCDMSKFDGRVYEQLGFKLLKWNRPSKHWYKGKGKSHITDNLLRQRGFDQLFGTNYGKGTDNEELMKQNGYVEIYDCGQATFVRNK